LRDRYGLAGCGRSWAALSQLTGKPSRAPSGDGRVTLDELEDRHAASALVWKFRRSNNHIGEWRRSSRLARSRPPSARGPWMTVSGARRRELAYCHSRFQLSAVIPLILNGIVGATLKSAAGSKSLSFVNSRSGRSPLYGPSSWAISMDVGSRKFGWRRSPVPFRKLLRQPENRCGRREKRIRAMALLVGNQGFGRADTVGEQGKVGDRRDGIIVVSEDQ
jgi:hypothetical protein